VAISRNVLDPTRSDLYYYNVQLGEASVANPAPGVSTEQLIHRRFPFPNSPEVEYQSQSSFMERQGVLTLPELRKASCYLSAIHAHFRARLDPGQMNRLFAIDVELKLVGEARALLIKQARPYSFGSTDLFGDCRDF
jgi:hypothetical protein